MAESITASVGRSGGVNRPADVKLVQRLLNKMLESEGGPKIPLAVDGLFGPKTLAAIEKFQKQQFGFKGMDGRVDPLGQTLKRLNELDKPAPAPPSPLPTPAPSTPTGQKFVIHRMATPKSFAGLPEELFFEFIDLTNGLIGDYWVQQAGMPMTTLQPPTNFSNASRSFLTKIPQAVDKLGCSIVYFSRQTAGVISSSMVFDLPGGGVQVADMPQHLIGPQGRILPGSGDVGTNLTGDLRFIKFR